MKSLLIILSTSLILTMIFYSIKTITHENRLFKLKQSRPNLSRQDYINHFVQEGFDEEHVVVVHDQIRETIQMDEFSIYPEDDLHKIYGIADLDDIELVDSICKKLNLRLAQHSEIEALNNEMTSFNARYILSLTKKLAEKSRD